MHIMHGNSKFLCKPVSVREFYKLKDPEGADWRDGGGDEIGRAKNMTKPKIRVPTELSGSRNKDPFDPIECAVVSRKMVDEEDGAARFDDAA